jgi:hypothetical protein
MAMERYELHGVKVFNWTFVKPFTITICVQVSLSSRLVTSNSDQCSAIVHATRNLRMRRRSSSHRKERLAFPEWARPCPRSNL